MATQSGWEMVPSRHQTLAPKLLARSLAQGSGPLGPQLMDIEGILRVPGVRKDPSVHGRGRGSVLPERQLWG